MSMSLMWLIAALLGISRGCPVISFTESSFRYNTNLRDLDLSRCQITHIPQDVFKPTTTLTNLNLRVNFLTQLTTSNFDGLAVLDTLDLSENRLTSLPDDFLHFMPLLKNLIINKNPLIEISSNALRISNLSRLKIDSNLMPLTLASRALADMTRLTDIELTNNGIMSLPGDLLDGSNAVERINLINNHIRDLPAGIFSNKTNLIYLNVNNNKLRELSPSAFADLHNLNWLKLDNNEIFQLDEGIFRSLNKLEILLMRDNGMFLVSPDALPASLKILGFGNNKLTTLETKLMPALKELDLSNNSFSRMPQCWSNTFPALEYLYLSYNKFTQLTKSDIAVLSNYPTARIRLTNNKIIRILVDECTSEIPILELEGAPLCCDCLMYEYATRILGDISVMRMVHCAEPASLNGTRLIDVPLTDFICHVKSCPDNCTCIIRPETKNLEMECREQLPPEGANSWTPHI